MFTSESVRLPSVCVTSDQTWHCWNLSYISSPNSKYYLLETLKYVFPEQANIVFPKFLPGESCVTWADRQKKTRGWADIFTRKGRQWRRQAKVKRPHSSAVKCVCLFGWPSLNFQFDFFPLFAQGYVLCKRPTEKVSLVFVRSEHCGQHTECKQSALLYTHL